MVKKNKPIGSRIVANVNATEDHVFLYIYKYSHASEPGIPSTPATIYHGYRHTMNLAVHYVTSVCDVQYMYAVFGLPVTTNYVDGAREYDFILYLSSYTRDNVLTGRCYDNIRGLFAQHMQNSTVKKTLG